MNVFEELLSAGPCVGKSFWHQFWSFARGSTPSIYDLANLPPEPAAPAASAAAAAAAAAFVHQLPNFQSFFLRFGARSSRLYLTEANLVRTMMGW